MNRHRAGGIGFTVGGAVLFAALLHRGSIRHPVDAAERTGIVEFGAITAAFGLVLLGCLLVLRSFMPVGADERRVER